ncbi:cell death protein 3-like [Mya arenaria]|uniref:cell death protein 3-like n=1 Tax=Mya arenaria TaxID=6604 RepID=UPI0022E05608|nr:cell death protein 3-like [Mya arenaria]
MDKKHKDLLRTNRSYLVEQISDLHGILDDLTESNIINENMRQEIESKDTKDNRTREFFNILPKRGPKAFDLFCHSLVKRHHGHVAVHLDPFYATLIPEDQKTYSLRNEKAGGDVKANDKEFDKGFKNKNKQMGKTAKEDEKTNYSQPLSVPVPGLSPKDPFKSKENYPSSKIKGTSQGTGATGESVIKSSEPGKSPGKGVMNKPSAKIKPLPPDKDLNVENPESLLPESLPDPNYAKDEVFEKEEEDDGADLPETAVDWPTGPKLDLGPFSTIFKVTTQAQAQAVTYRNAYPMTGKRKCLVISNQHFAERYKIRSGGDNDRYRFQNVMKELNFEYNLTANVKKEGLLAWLVAEREKITEDTCVFMLVIMSYGSKGDILCVDGDMISLQEIVDMFSSKNCKALQGKPKIVLVQAGGIILADSSETQMDVSSQTKQMTSRLSRLSLGSCSSFSLTNLGYDDENDCKGKSDDTSSEGASFSDPVEEENEPPSCAEGGVDVNDNSDFVVAVATSADDDNPAFCSLFILALSYILCKYSYTDHFLTILKKVNRLKLDKTTEERVEICQYKDALTKKLFLQPL